MLPDKAPFQSLAAALKAQEDAQDAACDSARALRRVCDEVSAHARKRRRSVAVNDVEDPVLREALPVD